MADALISDRPRTIPPKGDYKANIGDIELVKTSHGHSAVKITLYDTASDHQFYLYRFGSVLAEWSYLKKNRAIACVRVEHKIMRGTTFYGVVLWKLENPPQERAL